MPPTGKCFHTSYPWECRGGTCRVPGPQEVRPGAHSALPSYRRALLPRMATLAAPCSSCLAAVRPPPLGSEWPFQPSSATPTGAAVSLAGARGPANSTGGHRESGAAASSPRGPCQLCRWRQTQLGTKAAASSNQTQQGVSALAVPDRLDTSFPSSCRVLLASMRWQLPPRRMRKQDQWRQVRQQSTSPVLGAELWVWELAGTGCGVDLTWVEGQEKVAGLQVSLGETAVCVSPACLAWRKETIEQTSSAVLSTGASSGTSSLRSRFENMARSAEEEGRRQAEEERARRQARQRQAWRKVSRGHPAVSSKAWQADFSSGPAAPCPSTWSLYSNLLPKLFLCSCQRLPLNFTAVTGFSLSAHRSGLACTHR